MNSLHCSSSPLLPLLFLLFLTLSHPTLSSSSLPDHFINAVPRPFRHDFYTEYFEIAPPLPTQSFIPTHTLPLLKYDFKNTTGFPVTVPYWPPFECPAPWLSVVLQFRGAVKGVQDDRIVGIWLEGVELLRSSTAQPTETGVYWKVEKDVTKYNSLLVRPNLTLTVMLENTMNEFFTGFIHVEVSMLFYGLWSKTDQAQGVVGESKFNRKLMDFVEEDVKLEVVKGEDKGVASDGVEKEEKMPEEFLSKQRNGKLESGSKLEIFYDRPADLIIPISDDGGMGCWYKIVNESNVHSKEIQVPQNTYKAVLEIYVSAHGDDEFWYSNPPTSYFELNNLTSKRGNGAFRQVFVTLDDLFVGSAHPFPVIYSGGINPLLWEPFVGIGAFDLPTYDLELTPFLGFLLDGGTHFIRLGVTDANSYWLVNANLHLWLDPFLPTVTAGSIRYRAPDLRVKRESKFKLLDGECEVEAERKTQFSGWVCYSAGNYTTQVEYEFEFKNSIEFRNQGQNTEVEQRIKTRTEVRTEDRNQHHSRTTSRIKTSYPLRIRISATPGLAFQTFLLITNVSNGIESRSSVSQPHKRMSSTLSNSQVSGGWVVARDNIALSGTGNTRQKLRYRDENRCYSQIVVGDTGLILENVVIPFCSTNSY
ncbi:hypothetical protein Sjap_014092 [Stephania japonica]|uniref:Peptide N-acetyl-beta-D-glucosaminyl asparaginase amidase A N-terminal domain-containing protein n=1 Tax=Stephania japonica TaxID=461633 RepID=A0AAP0IZY7_9MAGN